METGIAGRVALVCGASAGIGRAIAAALAAEGARVAITSRSPERIRAAGAAIGAHPLVHDTGDLDAIPALVASVEDHFGAGIDVLVCNTGGPPANPDALAFTREEWERAHRTLVQGPVELIAAVVPGMRARAFGRIVNVVSTAAREPIGPLMLSNTERAGVLAAFTTIAHQVAADGITLNSLLTGRIATERLYALAGSQEAARERARTDVPAGRLGTPEEMAAAAVFFCSEAAGYITGTALAVDGGMSRAV
jgi:3-oxoacyl-[acyl-carrier protein] reductase